MEERSGQRLVWVGWGLAVLAGSAAAVLLLWPEPHRPSVAEEREAACRQLCPNGTIKASWAEDAPHANEIKRLGCACNIVHLPHPNVTDFASQSTAAGS